jgi:hypothetical protein
VSIHQHEAARQRARDLASTPEFAQAQRQRNKLEALFAELKNQFFLAAAAQNIKRLVRFLSQVPQPILPATVSFSPRRKAPFHSSTRKARTTLWEPLFQHPQHFSTIDGFRRRGIQRSDTSNL